MERRALRAHAPEGADPYRTRDPTERRPLRALVFDDSRGAVRKAISQTLARSAGSCVVCATPGV